MGARKQIYEEGSIAPSPEAMVIGIRFGETKHPAQLGLL